MSSGTWVALLKSCWDLSGEARHRVANASDSGQGRGSRPQAALRSWAGAVWQTVAFQDLSRPFAFWTTSLSPNTLFTYYLIHGSVFTAKDRNCCCYWYIQKDQFCMQICSAGRHRGHKMNRCSSGLPELSVWAGRWGVALGNPSTRLNGMRATFNIRKYFNHQERNEEE